MWHGKPRTISRALLLTKLACCSGELPNAGAPDLSFHSVPLPRFWPVSIPRQVTLSSSFLAPDFKYGLIRYHELPSYSRVLMRMVPIQICHCSSHQPCIIPLAQWMQKGVTLFSGVCSPSCVGFAAWSPTLSPQCLSVLRQEISLCRCFPRAAHFYSILSPPDQDRRNVCSFLPPFVL